MLNKDDTDLIKSDQEQKDLFSVEEEIKENHGENSIRTDDCLAGSGSGIHKSLGGGHTCVGFLQKSSDMITAMDSLTLRSKKKKRQGAKHNKRRLLK